MLSTQLVDLTVGNVLVIYVAFQLAKAFAAFIIASFITLVK